MNGTQTTATAGVEETITPVSDVPTTAPTPPDPNSLDDPTSNETSTDAKKPPDPDLPDPTSNETSTDAKKESTTSKRDGNKMNTIEYEQENCAGCNEKLPVDENNSIRKECCGLLLHKSCHAVAKKHFWEKYAGKRRTNYDDCVMCRAQYAATNKEVMKRTHAWVKKGKAWAESDMADAYARGGYGLPQSDVMADNLYRRAIAQGYPQAMFDLATNYEKGRGVEQSHPKSNEFYQMAAERNHTTAQYNLGCGYFSGEGLEQSYDLARQWWTKAAMQGDPTAQYNLGNGHYNGSEGVEESHAKARQWWTQAAKQGFELAIVAIQELDDLELEGKPAGLISVFCSPAKSGDGGGGRKRRTTKDNDVGTK